MKKLAIIAIAALAIAGCAKVVENMPAPAGPGTHMETLTAGFDGLTKTSYTNAGKFSWVAGDVIGVLYVNDETQETVQIAFTTEETGPEVQFAGEVPDGLSRTGIATYPFTGVQEGYACNDFALDDGALRLWGSIKPDVENPLASTPLTGMLDRRGLYQFRTACGILKFTIVNAPANMTCAYLETPSDSEAWLNGWFELDENGTILQANALESKGFHDRYNWNVPSGPNETLDVYFFLPVGTLPAGTYFAMLDENWGAIKSFSFARDVEVVRNAVTVIEPVVLDESVPDGPEIVLTEDNVFACDVCGHDGDGVPALVDNNPDTYWHSNWYYAVTTNDPVYGIYIDVTLPEALTAVRMKYQVRSGNANGKPTAVALGVSADGTEWTLVGQYSTEAMLNAAAGSWVTLPDITASTAFKYVRLGITDSPSQDDGSLTGDLNFDGYKKCTNLAELKVFNQQ